MIKKKTPVLLVTIVVAIGLGLVVLNMTPFLKTGGLMDIKAPDKEALQAVRDRQAASADSRIKTIKERSMLASIGPEGSKATLKNGIPETPSIAMPDTKKLAPQFDSETTSAHWYENESAQAAKAEKNAKSKGG